MLAGHKAQCRAGGVMTEHLLLIALGPVQDFIAQSRRTRDLWYGSHLLSELARCAARTLIHGGAKLIFPDLAKGQDSKLDVELEPCLSPLRPQQHVNAGQPPLSIANKILAELPANIDPAALARTVRNDVMAFWREGIALSLIHI